MYLTVIAGLTGSCWLSGIWKTTAVVTCLALLIVIAESSRYLEWAECIERAREVSLTLFVVPLITLAAASPLLLMRTAFGWEFCAHGIIAHEKRAVGLDELLLVVTSIAAMMFMTKVPQTMWGIPAEFFWFTVLSVMGVLAGLSFLTTVPTVWLMFRYRNRKLGWLLSIILLVISIAIVLMAIALMGGSTGTSWQESVLVPIIASLAYWLGLVILRLSGFELASYSRRASLVTNNLGKDQVANSELVDKEPGEKKAWSTPKRIHLLWSGFTLLIAAFSSIALATIESSRSRTEIDMSHLAAQLRADGGDLVCESGQPWRIAVGKSATDESIRQLASYRSLKELSLAGSHITDATLAALPDWFPELNRLDLGHTTVSAQGLLNIRKLKKLRRLGLAGTKLPMADINRAIAPPALEVAGSPMDHSAITFLDLSESVLTSDEFGQLDSTITHLMIRNMQFNDQDLSKICERSWVSLDISGNPCNGSGLNYANLQGLIAHDVPLTVQQFSGPSLFSLDIANTSLTDQAMSSLTTVQYLTIGDGNIRETGPSFKIVIGRIHSLTLHGREFTGECLLTLQQTPYKIDLSRSGITDHVLQQLGSGWKDGLNSWVNMLNLADTNISDVGLLGLNGCTIQYLDISRTKVTARALMDLELPNCQGIYVDFNQFTPDELRAIRQHHRVVVGEIIPDSMEQ